MSKTIIYLVLANLAVIWFICWPFDIKKATRDLEWVFCIAKVLFLVSLITFDIMFSYALGLASGLIPPAMQ